MRSQQMALLISTLMVTASIGAIVARPDTAAASPEPALSLEAMIPKRFGDWREKHFEHVVNPQERELLDKLYSNTLSRTYVNSSGYMIMLSLAHGRDQRGDLAAHMPEICYPANGFTLHRTEPGQLPDAVWRDSRAPFVYEQGGARRAGNVLVHVWRRADVSRPSGTAVAEKAGRAAVCVHRSNSRWTTFPSFLHRPRSGSSKPDCTISSSTTYFAPCRPWSASA